MSGSPVEKGTDVEQTYTQTQSQQKYGPFRVWQ